MKDKDKKVEPHLPNWLYSNAINLAYLEEEMLRQFPSTNLSRVFNEVIKRSRHYSTYILPVYLDKKDRRLDVK